MDPHNLPPAGQRPGSGDQPTIMASGQSPLGQPESRRRHTTGLTLAMVAASLVLFGAAVAVVLVLVLSRDGTPETVTADPQPSMSTQSDEDSAEKSEADESRVAEGSDARSIAPNRVVTDEQTTTTMPTTTELPSTVPTTESPMGALGQVVRTCGASGDGDCFVSLRSAPTSKAAELGRMNEGNAFVAECQVVGQSARSSVLGRSTSVWIRTPNGAFASAAFVDIPGFDPFTVTQPC